VQVDCAHSPAVHTPLQQPSEALHEAPEGAHVAATHSPFVHVLEQQLLALLHDSPVVRHATTGEPLGIGSDEPESTLTDGACSPPANAPVRDSSGCVAHAAASAETATNAVAAARKEPNEWRIMSAAYARRVPTCVPCRTAGFLDEVEARAAIRAGRGWIAWIAAASPRVVYVRTGSRRTCRGCTCCSCTR
jgi:hypothetical protein